MSLESEVGICLNSQQLREKIIEGSLSGFENFNLARNENGKFVDSSIEKQIQPSSFDPKIHNYLFVLDTETNGLFRPEPEANETIYRTLLQLPGRQRHRVDISEGFELKKGFTYLIPLEERIKLGPDEFVKSSPKSSLGRLFLNTRTLADYNPCFDEVSSQYKVDSELNLWLLVQPLAFNIIVYPGLSLNQLRFFKGRNTQLSPSEVIEEFKRNPLLYVRGDEDSLVPAKPIVTDGLQIRLDLSGQATEGIIGLRARHNPSPIDLRKKGEYEAEHFFEPLKGDKKITIVKGEYYLFGSKEVLKVPRHLNVELKDHSHVGLTGPLHFAGFIDNGFEGDLVFEVRSDELSDMVLKDGMPISKLDVFRTEIPDKLYGLPIGSHYQKQVGPRPPKFFKSFNFAFAARNYKKLDRSVLVQDAKILNSHRKNAQGLEFLTDEKAQALFHDIESGFFQSRYDCESDESILQPIPYVLVFGPNTIFSYVRAADIKDYGDERLFGKHSIGLGGHIRESDAPNYIQNCIEREVVKEEVEIEGNFSEPKLVGTLMQYDVPVDRVHFGLIYAIHTDGQVKPKEASIISGRMAPIEELINDPKHPQKYETWSRVLISHLPEIYKLL